MTTLLQIREAALVDMPHWQGAGQRDERGDATVEQLHPNLTAYRDQPALVARVVSFGSAFVVVDAAPHEKPRTDLGRGFRPLQMRLPSPSDAVGATTNWTGVNPSSAWGIASHRRRYSGWSKRTVHVNCG
jgi:hypothetical protein